MASKLSQTSAHRVCERGERALGPVPETVTADSFAGKQAVRWALEEAAGLHRRSQAGGPIRGGGGGCAAGLREPETRWPAASCRS